MNILIVGAGVVNKGAETMLRTVQSELGKRIDNAVFFMEKSEIPAGVEDQIQAMGIIILEREIPNKFYRGLELIGPIVFHPYLLKIIIKKRHLFWGWNKLLTDIDAIIDISGYHYREFSKPDPILRRLPVAFYAWARRKPFVFLPQAWGPFNYWTKIDKLCWWICKKGKLVVARDKQSQEYLAKLLKLPIGKVNLAPDIAFLFKPSKIFENEIDEIIRKINSSNELIGIVPNMRVYERSKGEGKENHYIKALINLSNFLIKGNKAVVLIPHEISPRSNAKDDRFLCKIIIDNIVDTSKIYFVNDLHSSEYLKTFISKCDLIVSSRFHGVVASLELCKPTVVIGWSHKYLELLNDVGLSDYVLDHNCNEKRLIKNVEKASRDRELIIQQLERTVPLIREQVNKLFDLVSSEISHSYMLAAK